MSLTLALALVATLAWSAPSASAQTEDDTTTTTLEAMESPSIIVRPNSGSAPTEAGDRGGALQTALFVAMVGGVLVIGGLVVRESRKARASRGF